MKVQLCPKCDGQGIVAKPPWLPAEMTTWVSHSTAPYTCGLCQGAKVIDPLTAITKGATA